MLITNLDKMSLVQIKNLNYLPRFLQSNSSYYYNCGIFMIIIKNDIIVLKHDFNQNFLSTIQFG